MAIPGDNIVRSVRSLAPMVLVLGGLAVVILVVSAWWGSSIDHNGAPVLARSPRGRRGAFLGARPALSVVRASQAPDARRSGAVLRTVSGVQRAVVVAVAVVALTGAAVSAASSPVRDDARRAADHGQDPPASPREGGSRSTPSRPGDDASPAAESSPGPAPVAATHPTPDPTPIPATGSRPSDGVTNFSGLRVPKLGGSYERRVGTARPDSRASNRAELAHARR